MKPSVGGTLINAHAWLFTFASGAWYVYDCITLSAINVSDVSNDFIWIPRHGTLKVTAGTRGHAWCNVITTRLNAVRRVCKGLHTCVLHG